MAQLLSQASALNPGQDLWIIPGAEESRWMHRLDWYLNFQMAKAQRHTRADISDDLGDVLTEIEWNPEKVSSAVKAPLLIPCADLLPARWVALVPASADLGDWTNRIHSLWSGLGKPSLKVFLPNGLQAGPFTEEWKKQTDNEEFSVVLD